MRRDTTSHKIMRVNIIVNPNMVVIIMMSITDVITPKDLTLLVVADGVTPAPVPD